MIKNIELPYGKKKISLNLSEESIKAVLVSGMHGYRTTEKEEDIVHQSLNNPIASSRLRELVKDKKKITIITSDHTRPLPSHITMPILLEEIKAGNPAAEITILIATGYHRATTINELNVRFGREIVEQERIVVHDCRKEEEMVYLGQLPSGGELHLNKEAVEADLLIAEGFIEPHFFAGFSGGRKSILPGVASEKTVLANHCSEFIKHQNSRTGILDSNPLHQDMLYAARKAKLAFILNVVINSNKRIINSFAGEPELAHSQGCKFVSKLAGVDREKADIVITTNGGYPLDQNIYQAVKSMTAAEACCNQGGVIIVLAECSDGHGGEGFYNTFARANTVEEVMTRILARKRSETIPDQWESQILARILLKYKVILVSSLEREVVEKMHLQWAPDVETALAQAQRIMGKEKTGFTIIPDGVSVIVR